MEGTQSFKSLLGFLKASRWGIADFPRVQCLFIKTFPGIQNCKHFVLRSLKMFPENHLIREVLNGVLNGEPVKKRQLG